MIPVLVEGDTDVPIVRRLLEMIGFEVGTVYGLRGKGWLDYRLPAYNHAARYARWFVLRDLNDDAHCAPELLGRLLTNPARGLCLRIAVRASEAWLLADKERMASFLSVSPHRIPANPDAIANPKREIVELARRSRRRAIREDIVPAAGTSSRVGPGYTARMIEFGASLWRPQIAATASASLSRSIAALERWAQRDI